MPYSANLIPDMTSDNTPSGQCFADPPGTFPYPNVWNAFDQDNTSDWWVGETDTGYIGYLFAATHAVTKYRFQTFSGGTGYGPTDWTFEGSNDAVDWDVLDTQTGQTGDTPDTWYEYEFLNTTLYNHYRINFSGSTGGPSGTVVFSSIEMFENENEAPVSNAGADTTAMTGIAKTLAGSSTDDGLPLVPGEVTYLWTKVSGSGTATFVDDTDPETDVTFSAADTYVLNLNADDGDLDDDDTVSIVVSDPVAPAIGSASRLRQSLGLGLGLGLGTIGTFNP